MLITVMAQATVIVLLLKEMRTSPLRAAKPKANAIGFIGCGAMAEAMARGFFDSKVVHSESIACYGGTNQTSNGRAALFKEVLGIENMISKAASVLDESDINILCALNRIKC